MYRCAAPRGRFIKKGSKVQKRKTATARGKTRKVSKAAKAMKRPVARAKPKRAPVKKAVRKERTKQPVAPVVESVAETVAVEVIEQPVAVTEVDEIRKAS